MNSIEFDGFHVSEYTSPMDPMMGIPSYGLNPRQHVESEQAVFDKSQKVSDNSGGHEITQIWENQTIQMYGNFEGVPLY